MSQPLILVVEDNGPNLRLYSTILQARDYRVISARDGVTGVAMAKANQPDLVVMDVQLPKMDGLTATRTLKEDPATVNIPVVMVTAYAMHEDREKGLKLGCDSYLTKPIDYIEFLAVVGELLRKVKAGRLKKVL